MPLTFQRLVRYEFMTKALPQTAGVAEESFHFPNVGGGTIDLPPLGGASVVLMEVEQVGLLAQAWCFGSDGLGVGSGWWVMMPWMLLFWGLIVGVAVWAFRQFTGRPWRGPARNSAAAVRKG